MGVGIEIRTSTDRIAWKSIGLVWPNGAPAATNKYTGTINGFVSYIEPSLAVLICVHSALWAPDCTYKNGVFYVSNHDFFI